MGKTIDRVEIIKSLMRSVVEKFSLDFQLLRIGEPIAQELAKRIVDYADAYLVMEMTDGFVVEVLQKISGDSTCPIALVVSVSEATFETGQIETRTIGIQLN